MRRPPPKPEPAKPGAVPLLVGLLVAGAVCAAGIAWIAPSPELQEASSDIPAPVSVVRAVGADTSIPPPENAVQPAFLDASAAGALAYAAGDVDGALAHYQAAIDRNPDDAESHSNLGQMLVRLKRTEEALPHFDRAIALLPQRWAYHFNRARALALLERWDEAIAGYRQAQQIFPDDYATAFNLAQTLHRKGDEAAAVEQYLRAIEMNPSDASFRLAIGISYERLDRRADAAAAYGEYLRLLPAAPDADRVRARIAQLTGTS
jgi:tetratricopeptide (TPR) repeat protein